MRVKTNYVSIHRYEKMGFKVVKEYCESRYLTPGDDGDGEDSVIDETCIIIKKEL